MVVYDMFGWFRQLPKHLAYSADWAERITICVPLLKILAICMEGTKVMLQR